MDAIEHAKVWKQASDKLRAHGEKTKSEPVSALSLAFAELAVAYMDAAQREPRQQGDDSLFKRVFG